MDDRIILNMTAAEAIIVYGNLEEAAAESMRAWGDLERTLAPKDEADATKVVAQILSRVVARLQDAIYPPCAWMDNDCCDRPTVPGQHYCRLHLERMAGKVPMYAREGR